MVSSSICFKSLFIYTLRYWTHWNLSHPTLFSSDGNPIGLKCHLYWTLNSSKYWYLSRGLLLWSMALPQAQSGDMVGESFVSSGTHPCLWPLLLSLAQHSSTPSSVSWHPPSALSWYLSLLSLRQVSPASLQSPAVLRWYIVLTSLAQTSLSTLDSCLLSLHLEA